MRRAEQHARFGGELILLDLEQSYRSGMRHSLLSLAAQPASRMVSRDVLEGRCLVSDSDYR